MSSEDKAYIAGFLDGDGSIMAQLVTRRDYKLGYQIRVSVVFFQKSTHKDFLLQLKEQLSYGYVRDRNDGMSEYTIVGLREVENVLRLLFPYLQLKKTLAREVLTLIEQHPEQRNMTSSQLVALSKLVDKTSRLAYSKRRTITSSTVKAFLKSKDVYVPVETGVQIALNEDKAT
jgi:hypothetical protein